MKKSIFIVFICLHISTFAEAQSNKMLEFNQTTHDFGTFSEDDDSRTYTFRFTNKSDSPVAIAKVTTTCGCTAAQYTRTPVAPQQEGFIKITYNPKGHPGVFKRSVFIDLSGSDKRITLTVEGKVTPGTPRKYADYNYVMGGLQLRNNTVQVRPLPGLTQVVASIMVINSSDQVLNIRLESDSPALNGEASPQTLRPDEKGELLITYSTNRTLKGDEKVYVILNGEKVEKNHIKVSGGK